MSKLKVPTLSLEVSVTHDHLSSLRILNRRLTELRRAFPVLEECKRFVEEFDLEAFTTDNPDRLEVSRDDFDNLHQTLTRLCGMIDGAGIKTGESDDDG